MVYIWELGQQSWFCFGGRVYSVFGGLYIGRLGNRCSVGMLGFIVELLVKIWEVGEEQNQNIKVCIW